MVSKNDENCCDINVVKERPVFIPPRKRQTNKKQNGTQNYVDHIANVQVRAESIFFINRTHLFLYLEAYLESIGRYKISPHFVIALLLCLKLIRQVFPATGLL